MWLGSKWYSIWTMARPSSERNGNASLCLLMKDELNLGRALFLHSRGTRLSLPEPSKTIFEIINTEKTRQIRRGKSILELFCRRGNVRSLFQNGFLSTIMVSIVRSLSKSSRCGKRETKCSCCDSLCSQIRPQTHGEDNTESCPTT